MCCDLRARIRGVGFFDQGVGRASQCERWRAWVFTGQFSANPARTCAAQALSSAHPVGGAERPYLRGVPSAVPHLRRFEPGALNGRQPAQRCSSALVGVLRFLVQFWFVCDLDELGKLTTYFIATRAGFPWAIGPKRLKVPSIAQWAAPASIPTKTP